MYYYSEEAAQRVVNWIEMFCTHTKGDKAGQPFLLEDWQKKDIINPLFGTLRKDNDKRKYSTCYVEIPRKNGKSTLAACVALYCLMADNEKGAEIVSAAGDRQQSKIIFDVASDMIRANAELSKRCTVLQNKIRYGTSFYQSISSESRTKHGYNCSAIIFDELHTQPNDDLWQVLRTSVLSRSQPITLALTTAGDDIDSIAFSVHEYAKKVQQGIIKDDTFLPVLYCADHSDDWRSPKVWAACNPNLGISCNVQYFKDYINRIDAQPSELYTFQRLHLNIWTNSQAAAWIQDHDVQKGAGELPSEETLKRLPCWGGLDLSSTRDLTAFAMVWRDGSKYYTKVYQFVPKETAANRQQYKLWAEQGHLEITSGNVVDYDRVRDYINEMQDKYGLRSVAYDRKFSAYIVPQLIALGIDLQPFGQGFLSMSHPSKLLERTLVSGNICGINEVLRWQFSCCKVSRDPADNIKITKSRNKAGEMVDGIVSLIMALGQSELEQDTDDLDAYTVFTL